MSATLGCLFAKGKCSNPSVWGGEVEEWPGEGLEPANSCLSAKLRSALLLWVEVKPLMRLSSFIPFACYCNIQQSKHCNKLYQHAPGSEAASDLQNAADRAIKIQLVTQSP